jgi:hypothetical protein
MTRPSKHLRQIMRNYFQFDLYGGHKSSASKSDFIVFFNVLDQYQLVFGILKILILDNFWPEKVVFDLYAGRLIREYIQ